MDLAYPSNRLALIASIITGMLVAVITRDFLIAVSCGATTFSTWALGRELDPDRPRTANLSAITVSLVFSILALTGRLIIHDTLLGTLVTGTLMVVARTMTRSTGLGATVFDAFAVFAVALGVGLIDPKSGLILVAIATVCIVMDRALEQYPYLANWQHFAFAFFAMTTLLFLLFSGPWAMLTGFVLIVGTLNIWMALKFTPRSSSDIGTKLEPCRITMANALVFLAATCLASLGVVVAVVGLLAVGLWGLRQHP